MKSLGESFRAAVTATGIVLMSASSTHSSMPPPDMTHAGFTTRGLTQDEIRMGWQIFGSSLDYSRIRVTRTNDTRNKGFHGKIRMINRLYSDNYGRETDLEKRRIFMHEMAHIWQEQSGVSIIGSAIGLFFQNGGDYNKAYNYNMHDIYNFRSLNIEQQASIIEDYFVLREAVKADRRLRRTACPSVRIFEQALKPSLPGLQELHQC